MTCKVESDSPHPRHDCTTWQTPSKSVLRLWVALYNIISLLLFTTVYRIMSGIQGRDLLRSRDIIERSFFVLVKVTSTPIFSPY